jgi:putative transposase
LENVVASTVLGSERFVAWVQEEFLGKKPADRELPALRKMVNQPGVDAIRDAVANRFGENKATARQVGLYLCHQHTGLKLKELGAEYGVTESAVTQASRRVAEALKENESLRKAVQQLKRELDLSTL